MNVAALDRAQSLPATADFFRAIVEAMPSAVVVVDSSGTIVLVNRYCERTFGYARRELLGESLEVLLPERYRNAHRAQRERFLKTSRRRPMGIGQEFYALRRDGSEFPVEIGLNPVHSDHGRFVVSALVDITERKRLEARARAQAEALARSRAELEIHRHYEHTLTRHADELGQANQALEAARRELVRQAKYDHLTGLANRLLFEDFLKGAVARARRGQRGLAVLFLDLDDFKAVNDRFGHAIGDRLLRSFATRLSGCVRAGDLAARMGGDEFAVVVDAVDGPSTAEQIAQKILDVMRESHDLGGDRISLGTSIGIAVFPRDGDDPAALLKAADAAMYTAKRQGRGRSVLAS